MPQPGDVVTRMLAGSISMPLRVGSVTEDRVVCGGWEFCKKTGAEIDDVLDWGPPPRGTGSFLRMKDGEIEVVGA